MRRGQVLRLLSKSNSAREPDEPQQRADDQLRCEPPPSAHASAPTQPTPSPCELSEQQPVSTRITSARGRGGLIARQIAARSRHTTTVESQATEPQVPQYVPEPISDPRDPSTRSDTTPSRRDSTGSSSSSLSQHFAKVVEPEQTVKTLLPKEASNQGAAIQMSVNYMTFETKGSPQVYEYHADFNPSIESIRLRNNLLRSEPCSTVIGRVMHWTGTNLYLPIKLDNRETNLEVQNPINGQPVKIMLTFVKVPPDEELLPFYNSLMHKVMTRLRYVIFNRKHFSPELRISIPEYKLEVWPGWVTAVQRLDGGLKLVIDSSFKVIRLDTVRDLLREIRDNSRGLQLKEAFEQRLVGSIVMTTYNNKAYRIDGIDIKKKPTDTFVMDRANSRPISYVDYMREHWNVQVNDLNQPMIVHYPKPKPGQTGPEVIYLVPELCVATGLTEEMRANYQIMKAVGDHTRLPPDIRELKLTEFLQQISTDERAKTVLDEWNLSVKPTLDILPGRRLENETILFGGTRTAAVPDNADWTRGATSGTVFKSVDIENWALMYCERDNATAEDLMVNIREISRTLGIRFCKPRLVKLSNDSSTTFVNACRTLVQPTDQMVVLLTPGKSQREDRYSACKRIFCCEKGIPCQFIRCGTINNPRKIRSVCQKIVIQILSKVGGQPWAIRFPMKSFMIIGIDTYHDTIDRKKSCVGFVASMNEFATSWWSHTFYQDSLEEIGQKVASCLTTALKRFHRLNRFLPNKVIVYRDGVGDGQLEAVVKLEIGQIVNSVDFYMRNEFGDEPVPKLSYIIVQKRINTKMSLRQFSKTSNPLPGSFIDHSITHPDYNDFYLVSQHVNQGTVSPTKYILLTEQGNLKLAHHQKLAYKMTHMYFNWCGTVRVPAPCQYAHKLAYLNGENVRQQVLESIEDKLYYL